MRFGENANRTENEGIGRISQRYRGRQDMGDVNLMKIHKIGKDLLNDASIG